MNIDIKKNQQNIIDYLNIQQQIFNCLDFCLDENGGTAKVCVQHGKENELYKVLLFFNESKENLNSELDKYSRVLSIPIKDAKIPKRVRTILLKNNIKTLGELKKLTINDVKKIKQLGWQSKSELIYSLSENYGIELNEY